MKQLLPHLALACLLLAPGAFAAPSVSQKDLSKENLKTIATPRQIESLKNREAAKKAAADAKAKADQEVAKVTKENDAGMLRTIQKRSLNNMLPACEREPESPREPGNYEVR